MGYEKRGEKTNGDFVNIGPISLVDKQKKGARSSHRTILIIIIGSQRRLFEVLLAQFCEQGLRFSGTEQEKKKGFISILSIYGLQRK